MRYFKYLPKINYCNEESTNLLVRAKIRDMILNNSVSYHPYIVTDNDRPDIISFKYYGNVNHTWVIFYANEIFHPIWDWPLKQNTFNRKIAAKYGSTQNALTTPHHYLNTVDNLIIDQFTYNNTPESDRKIVSIYDHEFDLNEQKRQIKLIDVRYIPEIVTEIRRIF